MISRLVVAGVLSLLCAASAYSDSPEPIELDTGNQCSLPSSSPEEESIALLALSVSPGPCLKRNVYQRLLIDIRTLKAANPQLRDILYRGGFDSRSLLITMSSEESVASALEGALPNWRELIDHVGGAKVTLLAKHILLVRFERPQNIPHLASEFRNVPGILRVDLNHLTGSGSSLCAYMADDLFAYIFDIASGDCASRCTHHHLYYFKSTKPGVIVSHDEWRTGKQSAQPEWVDRYLKAGRCD